MSLRALLDSVPPNSTFDMLRELPFGSLLNALIKALTFTETGIVPSSNVGVLANQPSSLGVLRVLATAETGTTHEKEVLIGPITGTQALVPGAGVCVWDGGKNILFNATDAVTAFSTFYLKDSDTTAGVLQRSPGTRTTP